MTKGKITKYKDKWKGFLFHFVKQWTKDTFKVRPQNKNNSTFGSWGYFWHLSKATGHSTNEFRWNRKEGDQDTLHTNNSQLMSDAG